MFDVDVALDATVDGDDDVSDLAATKRMATRCPGLLREMTWQERSGDHVAVVDTDGHSCCYC
jgi:hypothetical protein